MTKFAGKSIQNVTLFIVEDSSQNIFTLETTSFHPLGSVLG